MESESELKSLLEQIPQTGSVRWIGVRPARRSPLRAVERVRARAGKGLQGDHYRAGGQGRRQVTLIQAEHLAVIGSLLAQDTIEAGLLRRNIVVAGINLLALKDKRFHIGSAVLEGSGLCQPCSRMEQNLGEGGYNAVRGHGGITARVIVGGDIALGDPVRVAPQGED